MKKLLKYKRQFTHYLLSAVIILAVCSSLYGQSKPGIQFTEFKNWAEVLKLANQQQKSIFVDLYTTWCGPCKQMDEKIYSSIEIDKLFNTEFIAVKIQMDSTKYDDAHTKSWYKDASLISVNENIKAFPTLLYYSSDGHLVFKAIGYKNIDQFNRISKFASQPDSNVAFRKILADYQNGNKIYNQLSSLSTNVREILGDNKLALAIATDFKENYLDKLNQKDFFRSENIKFIAENGNAQLINSKDLFFDKCYNQSQYIDSILGKGMAQAYVNAVVSREEISNKLYNRDLPITKRPNWEKLIDHIHHKYKKIDAESLVIDTKQSFYKSIGDWDLYTKYRSEDLKRHPVQGSNFDIVIALNEPAWEVFRKTDNKNALKRALEWSKLSIKLVQDENKVELYDTQANILYKIGQKQEAIKLQERAIAEGRKIDQKNGNKGSSFSDVAANLEKMKKGFPTW